MQRKNLAMIFCLGVLNAGIAFGGPADYVYTPIVESGEKEIDFKYGTDRQKDGTLKQVSSIGLGYGVSESWFTEVYLKRETAGGAGITLAEWENKFQLTETGKHPVDVGLVAELEAPLNNGTEPYEFKFGPLFQSEFGKVQLNGNLLWKSKFGHLNDGDDPYITGFGYQWQIKYRLQRVFEYGLQGFGEMGKWNDLEKQADQNHRFGPAVFGKLALGKRQAIKYNAAWLFGASKAAPDDTFRMQVEYEF